MWSVFTSACSSASPGAASRKSSHRRPRAYSAFISIASSHILLRHSCRCAASAAGGAASGAAVAPRSDSAWLPAGVAGAFSPPLAWVQSSSGAPSRSSPFSDRVSLDSTLPPSPRLPVHSCSPEASLPPPEPCSSVPVPECPGCTFVWAASELGLHASAASGKFQPCDPLAMEVTSDWVFVRAGRMVVSAGSGSGMGRSRQSAPNSSLDMPYASNLASLTVHAPVPPGRKMIPPAGPSVCTKHPSAFSGPRASSSVKRTRPFVARLIISARMM
mmetsp:Transcript_16243/g.35303  ORF Transcript_16243/g.35303 Transcript_16243/m.35303 type:complete len:273 (-) Transcript_16243:1361-2179(-)